MSTISAGTTVGTALVQTGDTTGNLVIKTGSSATTALTISGADQSITVAGGLNLGAPIAIASGGTGQTTRQAAMDALAGAVTAGRYLRGDGTDVIMDTLKAADMTGTLAAANGGTGLTSPGTSGNVLTSNGTSWVSSTPSSGPSGITSQVFTSNGTFTIPTGVTALKVTVQAGSGGSGGSANAGCSNGLSGGTGGGGAGIKYLTGLTPGNTISVVVGGGGAATAAGGNSSISSGTQTISTVTATGSAGTANAIGTTTAGSTGGSATGADLTFQGEPGIAQITAQMSIGGSSLLGLGVMNRTNDVVGVQGTGYGGGSCGVFGTSTTTRAGAAGRAGVVIFEW